MNGRHSFFCSFVFFLIFIPLSVYSALFGEFSLQDEQKMGEKFSLQIKKHFYLVDDPYVTDFVQDIVDRLAKELPPQPFPFRARVIVNSSLNAFAIAAGHVYIFTGLLLQAEHEAQIAAILAHEMGHVIHRHIARRLEQGATLNLAALLGVLAGAVIGGDGGNAFIVGSLAGARSSMLSYSRDNEREADQVGLRLLIKSGYPPQAMVQIFKIMQKKSRLDGESLPVYLSTHPALDERIGIISSQVQRVEGKEKRLYEDERFLRVQTFIRGRYGDAKNALLYFEGKKSPTAMELLSTGIVLSRLNRIQEAEAYFFKALEREPNNPLFLRETGRFLFEYSAESQQAFSLLSEALKRNPKDFVARFFLARILAEQEKFFLAIREMQAVLQAVPFDWEVHFYLGRYHGLQKQMFPAHLHLASSFFFQGKIEKARFHLKKAKDEAKTEQDEQAIVDFQKKWEMWNEG